MKRVNTSFSVIVVTIPLKEEFTILMAAYNYTNKCLISSWLVTIPLKEVFTLHDRLQLQRE
jgi:hypothetical protein